IWRWLAKGIAIHFIDLACHTRMRLPDTTRAGAAERKKKSVRRLRTHACGISWYDGWRLSTRYR
ncbi:MAG: hypothetical protein ACKN9U_11520, partial [Pirellulaceae bacterium]